MLDAKHGLQSKQTAGRYPADGKMPRQHTKSKNSQDDLQMRCRGEALCSDSTVKRKRGFHSGDT